MESRPADTTGLLGGTLTSDGPVPLDPDLVAMLRAVLSGAAAVCDAGGAVLALADGEARWEPLLAGAHDCPPQRFSALAELVITGAKRLTVLDAGADARIPAAAQVPGWPFFAGIPLIDRDGSALGALAVVDTVPRRLDESQSDRLQAIARQLALEIELRRTHGRLRRTEHALVGQRAMHDAIVTSALDCIVTIDGDGRVVEFNPAATRTFGYPRDVAIGRMMSELIIPPRLREGHRHGLARIVAGGGGAILNRRIELEAMRADGTEFPIELTVSQLAADPPLFAGFIRDITERRRAEADQRRLAAIVHSTQDVVIGLDLDLRITHWNTAAEQLYGYSVKEMVGQTLAPIVPDDYRDELDTQLARLLAGEAVGRLETERLTKDGRRIEVAVTLSPITDRGGRLLGVSVIGRDITARKALEGALRHQADHDPLSGLLNRRVFEWRLEALTDAQEAARVGSVVFIDLDHFKLVNDSLGHRAGDELIRRVARVLQDGAPADATVARLGGDEFAVLLPGWDDTTALELAEQLIAQISAHSPMGEIGASAGVAEVSAGTSAEDVMVAADMAVYEAKTVGRRAVRHAGMSAGALQGVVEVKRAIDEGRLIVHAQPIIELGADTVVRHELLVRMRSADGELISPGHFIPIAERFGLIEQIDRWVLRVATDLAQTGMAVAVNLSAHTLADPATVALIRGRLAAGVPAGNLSFEITETAALADLANAGEFARLITELGCELALDDFGTGFGSLVHLKRLPVTTVKIDMEFVRDLVRTSADRDIVRGLVSIARSLGHRTVAEGVEDAATLTALRELGVDEAQGYHIGRPAPLSSAAH